MESGLTPQNGDHRLPLTIRPAIEIPATEQQDLILFCSRAFNDDFSRLFSRRPSARHAVISVESRPMAHGCWEPWQVEINSVSLPAAWISAMAVDPEMQRQGLGRAILDALVADYGSLRIGILSAAIPAFYERSGWTYWPGGTVRQGQDPDEPIMVRLGDRIRELDQTRPFRVLSRAELGKS